MEQINSIILTKFTKYKKEDINEIFEELRQTFVQGDIYIFIEDLSTNILVNAYKYKILNNDLTKLNKSKEKLLEKLIYYKKYKKKYLMHYYFFPKKGKCIDFFLTNDITSVYKKVLNYYKLSNDLNSFEKLLIQLADFSLKNPIKVISLLVTIALFYILIIMYLKGLKPEEIDMSTLSLTIEIFILLIGFFVFIYFIILFLPLKLMGINWKVILGSFIILFFIMYALIFGQKQKSFNNYIIEQYLMFKKYPRFATLIISEGNDTISKHVLLRFISNKYIYYNSLCDINFSKINSDKLSVLDFLIKNKNNLFFLISTSKVSEIINIHYLISINELKKICNNKK